MPDIGWNVVLGMTEMGVFVHCRAAGIPSHLFPCQINYETAEISACQAVVELRTIQLAITASLGGVRVGG